MIKRLHFLAGLLLLAACSDREPAPLHGDVDRMISLAPDITETIFALGLGDKLVGATTWCNYPEAAKDVPRVGGFGQFNFEAIVAAQPDLVVLHEQYAAEKNRLDGLGIPYLETNIRSVADIRGALEKVGAACGAEDRAQVLVAQINAACNAAEETKRTGPRPRVLIIIGSEVSGQIYAIGMDSLHHEVLTIAGGGNALQNNLPNAQLSKEAIVRLNPEIIIQLAPGSTAPANPAAAWSDLSGIDAVKNNRVYVLTGNHISIPGPRVDQIIRDFTEIVDRYE